MTRAKWLYFKCEGKFSPSHKCVDKVSLHVLEELMGAFQVDSASAKDQDQTPSSDSETELMSLSEDAMYGTSVRKTFKLQGFVGKTTIPILIDCGSSHNIITEQLAKKHKLDQTEVHAAEVKLVDGTPMACTSLVS